jgi:phosphoribosylanthranilate isomerase
MTVVKICGLRTAEHTLAAVEAGADMLGFIFAPARRQVGPDVVAEIAAQVRAAPTAERSPCIVGVFVNETPERMLEMADICGLDVLQLSGDEAVTVAGRLADRTILKTLRLAQAAGEEAWLELERPNVHLLVDAHIAGSYGGAGVVADWDRAAELACLRPIVLAGGLTPANVGAAIRHVRPWAVDVSSGVETDGVKDSTKIRAFVAAVRAADASGLA